MAYGKMLLKTEGMATPTWRENQTMPVLSTSYEHIILDESSVPTIEGTSMKVLEIVLETAAY